LSNLSTNDATDATVKGGKKNFIFEDMFGTKNTAADGEEGVVSALVADTITDVVRHNTASSYMSLAVVYINTHASLSVAAGSAVEDVVDDYLGGSYSEAMDVMQ